MDPPNDRDLHVRRGLDRKKNTSLRIRLARALSPATRTRSFRAGSCSDAVNSPTSSPDELNRRHSSPWRRCSWQSSLSCRGKLCNREGEDEVFSLSRNPRTAIWYTDARCVFSLISSFWFFGPFSIAKCVTRILLSIFKTASLLLWVYDSQSFSLEL